MRIFCMALCVALLSSGAAYADVIEFKKDGSIVSHVAKDYRRKPSVVYALKMPKKAKRIIKAL